MYTKRIAHLEELHRMLDQQINSMVKKYDNDLTVTELKKKKLALKDQIDHLRRADQIEESNHE